MRRMKLKIIMAMLMIIIVLIAITLGMMNNDNPEKDIVYVVVKAVSNEMDFWQTVRMGAMTAAVELDVEMIFTGPMHETQIERQIEILDNIIKRKPLAIVLAPTDYKKLAPWGDKILEAGITLVTIDSAMDTPSAKSFIGTNNIDASRQAGEVMIGLLEGAGKVAVMGHVQGTSTAIERIEGFMQAIHEHPGIKLVREPWYSDGTSDQAYLRAKEMLLNYPDIDGIFGSNEVTVIGIARALDDMGLGGRIKLVGFDGSKEQVGFIEQGILHAVMVQRPFNMGYLGVKEAVEISRRRKRPEVIDTGAVLITRDNLYAPENQKLLFPFVNR